LVASYAGDQLQEIEGKEKLVLDAWKDLLSLVQKRAALLSDALDKHRFLNMYRDLIAWMKGVLRQMNLQEKPRWVFKVNRNLKNALSRY